MYGLKETGIFAFNRLVQMLAPYGYKPMPFTPGLWKDHTKRTSFILCFDDFGIKSFSKDGALHLINALRDNYALTIDWTGTLYCGLDLMTKNMSTSS